MSRWRPEYDLTRRLSRNEKRSLGCEADRLASISSGRPPRRYISPRRPSYSANSYWSSDVLSSSCHTVVREQIVRWNDPRALAASVETSNGGMVLLRRLRNTIACSTPIRHWATKSECYPK